MQVIYLCGVKRKGICIFVQTFVNSENSDQPADSCILIRVFLFPLQISSAYRLLIEAGKTNKTISGCMADQPWGKAPFSWEMAAELYHLSTKRY